RVIVSNIDKGKGQVGAVTHDGFQNVNSFAGKDVFVMGQNAADWAFHGKEVIGSNNGGDSFQLGKDLAPLVQTTNLFGGGVRWADFINNAMPPVGEGPGRGTADPLGRGRLSNEAIGKLLQSVGGMFNALSGILQLSSRISLGRYQQNLN